MSFQQEVFTLIARLGASENKIALDRTFCQFMGSLEGGVFLSQLLYWSDRGKKRNSFYKSYKEWYEETFLSKYQVNQAAKQCIEMGFLTTEVRRAEGSPTVHYYIDSEKFLDLILAFVRKQSVEMDSQKFDEPESKSFDEPKSKNQLSLTETTSKITKEGEEWDHLWSRILETLKAQIPANSYASFVAPAKLTNLCDGTATITIPNSKAKDWIENRLARQLKQLLSIEGKIKVTDIRVETEAPPTGA